MTLFLPFSNHVATKSFDFISSIIYFLLGPQYLKNHIRSLSCNYWKKDHQYSLLKLHGDPSTLACKLRSWLLPQSSLIVNHFKESMSSVIIAMIPARLGSKRLPRKNLCKINDVTLLARAARKCKAANIFDSIWINSESLVFKKIAEEESVLFHHRPSDLADDNATSEQFVKEF